MHAREGEGKKTQAISSFFARPHVFASLSPPLESPFTQAKFLKVRNKKVSIRITKITDKNCFLSLILGCKNL